MITLRLHHGARASLDAVAERTDRPLGWILGQAVIEAMLEIAHTETAAGALAVLGPHLASPPHAQTTRMTTTLPKHCEHVVDLLVAEHTRLGGPPASATSVVRAAWARWIASASVDDIARQLGAVMPPMVAGVA